MKREYLITTALIVLCAGSLSVWAAEIYEEEKTIKTYPFSDPEPLPMMFRASIWGESSRFYPYFFFSKFSDTATERNWKVIRMENPYIEVFILPQVGGKIYGAIEKSTKNEFIYLNSVMKFRDVAIRGPWTSGGIECNFGAIAHTPACASPVDYLTEKNPDGSVSCIVGTMDIPSRTYWTVKITVPADKAFFETKAFWYNPTTLHQSNYAWMNAAVQTAGDLEYSYPGHWYIGHSFGRPPRSWPVDNGHKISWYKHNNFGFGNKSYFIFGEYEDFSGGYWHDNQFGFGHWALYEEMPGKKIWIWSLARWGAMWEDLLTDNDGQYSEPQTGRLLNQEDHEFLSPYTTDRWREIWFPYKEIGPMVKATPYGVLNVSRDCNGITLGVCPLQKLDDDLVVTAVGKEVYREHLRLRPMETYKKKLPLTIEEGKLGVNLAKKICYSDDPQANDLHRPIIFHEFFDANTTEGLYLTAERFEKQRLYQEALEKYLACLEKEPLHTRALSRVAELYCQRAEYKKALKYAEKLLENLMYDPDGNYIYGVISRHLGNLVDAKETLGWAARSMKYRSNA